MAHQRAGSSTPSPAREHVSAATYAHAKTTGDPGAPFYFGHSPGAMAPPRGKQMQPRDIDARRFHTGECRDDAMDEEARKLEEQRSAFDRKMGDSDAAHRGKRMFGEGAHKANAYLFVEYGSFPPPKARPFGQTRDTSPEKLEPFVHRGNDIAREREISKIASTPSAFDKNFADGPLQGFFRMRGGPGETPLSTKRAQRGLLDGVMEKTDDAALHRTGKRVLHHEDGVLAADPNPIPGLHGVGVGQEDRFDRIRPREKKETMPPMQPHFGTKHDAKYGVHGFTTAPPAPPPEERSGWFNWTEDRQRCPVNDAGFDPLALKKEYCSPGDPLNHPQRLKRIDLGTPQTHYLLRNDRRAQDQMKAQCVKMYPRNMSEADDVVVGFRGLGDAEREAALQKPRGVRHLEPHHEQPRRARSSLDTYELSSDYYHRAYAQDHAPK
uniref:Uncharacterized protein n=1 Tax=Neobodo designis TaxID=312471 RepID=A0A7S1PPM6_NEODS|mmetsp:Transcript_13301/g.41374  ORF Transcript_13301/g.41374 Transcript_13301/m.41374 type:complete len:438 (+) Transcript_13301:125-1438(+)|eukprot:CAMPEP_0174837480 /NCGR_PEP_ID=MMETSP1114-20130205/6767_1 /TAXON_ID=312471 /ORGANISM="Neobodo designis, Strain CCAP 1951/1" /LENGTH=437 /DNA_ID=CAMNT_0016071547 /DNA_START=125 /DNA_END=1438 /DNA_ORIENTATION=+